MKRFVKIIWEKTKTTFYLIPWRFVLVVFLLYDVYYFIDLYKKWNTVPYQEIEAHVSSEGVVSNKSYCNFYATINAGGTTQKEIDQENNKITIYNSSDYTDTITLDKFYNGQCKYIPVSYPEKFIGKKTFYYLDYRTYTSVDAGISPKEHCDTLIGDEKTLSYIEQPQLRKESSGISATRSGLLGYCLCDGVGYMFFHTNLVNSHPSLRSPWDITQANYNIKLTCDKIKCDTISIEFYGATNFSAMYPIPDKTTMSGIEFVDSTKITEILNNGLRFHTEFLQLKEMSARRTLLLTIFISLLVSLIVSVIFRFFLD